MKVKVWMFANNGNDILQKNKDVEKVRDHVYFYRDNDGWNDNNMLVIENEGQFFSLSFINNDKLAEIKFDDIVSYFNRGIENDWYFNKIELSLMRTISEDLYNKGVVSRENSIKRREANALEREKRELERLERQKKKEEERIAQEDAMLSEIAYILKPDLTKMQRGMVLKHLEEKRRFNFNDGRIVCCTIFELITKHGYNVPRKFVDEYTKNGYLRSKPLTEYYLMKEGRNLMFNIPGRLGQNMVAK